MKAPAKNRVEPVRTGDIVITVVLLVTFVAAYVVAQAWPVEARLFPQLLCVAGTGFGLLKLVGFGIQLRRGRQPRNRVGAGSLHDRDTDGAADEEDEQEADGQHAPEYVFGTAGRRAWAAAIGWAAAFFVLLYVVGVFVTVPLFALVYLTVCGRHHWLGAVVYAGVAGGFVWFVFSRLLEVPMPAGIF